VMTNRSRWSPDEKIRIVLESLNTNISMAELCRKYNVTPVTFYAWKEKFVQGGKLALSGQLKDPAKEKQAENDRLKKLIGELTIANEAMKEVLRGEGKK
jgi:transposase-like protein